MKTPLIVALIFAAAANAQDALSEGRRLTAELNLDQQADSTLLAAVGYGRAQALLMEVVKQGQSTSATPEDWANLHRATSGLIELYIAKGELPRASVFASLQDGYYRNFDHNYPLALTAARLALELQKNSATLSAVGRDLRSTGQPANAVPYIQEALEIVEVPLSKSAGQIWRDLIQAHLEQADLPRASEEAVRFLAASRNGVDPFRALALLANADVLFAGSQHGPALDALRQARTAGADEWVLTAQLLSCVLLSMRTLNHQEAVQLAQRMEVEFPGLPVSVSAFAHQAIQTRRLMAGDIDGVLREQALLLAQARAANKQAEQTGILLRMAATYRAANNGKDQIAALEAATELDRSLQTLNLLGDAYLTADEPGKAHAIFGEVIRRIEAIPEESEQSKLAGIYGEAMLGRSQIAMQEDDPDEARRILRQALAGSIKLAKFSREDVLWQSARLERAEGAWSVARHFYEQTIEALQATRNTRLEVVLRVEYAHFLALSSNSADEARVQIEAARVSADKLNMTESQWRLAYEAGIVAESLQDSTAAARFYRDAIQMLESMQAGLTLAGQRQSLMDTDTAQDLYRRALGMVQGGDAAKSWEIAEQAKARTFRDQLQGRRFADDAAAPAADSLRKLEDRITALRQETLPANDELLRSTGREPAVMRNELHKLESRFAFERQQPALTGSRSGQSMVSTPVALIRIQKLLSPSAALIEFSELNDGLLAFVITTNSVDKVRCNIKPEALRSAIGRLRMLLTDPQSADEMRGVVERLSAALWQPVASLLPKSVNTLLIAPTGLLNYVPFQVLESRGRPLLEFFTISYLPNASVLSFLNARPPALEDLFLGAIGNATPDGIAPLPGTLRETSGIAQLFPGATQRLGDTFTHDEARNALLQHQVVHFATHGLNEQSPLFSALVTAPTAGQPSRLSLYELPGLRLKAKLVVLSACETGLGRLSGGGEIAGLTRTFLLAGANTVVSSLWKVSDDSTALLMGEFYGRMRQGVATAQAMREAALTVRKTFPQPFYWAPFVVTGAN